MKKLGMGFLAFLLIFALLAPCALADGIPSVTEITSGLGAESVFPMSFEMTVVTTDNARSAKLMCEDGTQLGNTINAEDNGDGTKVFTIEVTLEKPKADKLTAYVQDYDKLWHQSTVTFELKAGMDGGASADSSATPWDAEAWPTYFVRPAKVNSKRFSTSTGPDKEYPGAGSYVTRQIETIEALFIEHGAGQDYVYVDMQTKNGYHRRLFVLPKLLADISEVPEMTLVGFKASLTRVETPYFGPGKLYDRMDKVSLARGQRLTVYHEENDFVYCDFETVDGINRGWLPSASVKAE